MRLNVNADEEMTLYKLFLEMFRPIFTFDFFSEEDLDDKDNSKGIYFNTNLVGKKYTLKPF